MKYINSAVRFFSIVAGVLLFGLLTMILYLVGVPKPWAWGMIAGAGFAIIVAVFMAFLNYREFVKFEEARSRVEGVVLEFSLATVCNLDRVRRAYFFLTAEVMRLFLWDRRPYLESTVRREDVVITYRTARPNHVTIVFDDNDTLELIFPNAQELLDAMRDHGYRVEEVTEHV